MRNGKTASSSMFTNTCSLSEANTSASIYFAATSQSYANASGSCIINYYYNTATSSIVQKNNCPVCQTGSFVTYSLAASQSQFTSTCSFAEAQSNFIAYFNSTSQSYANTNGGCTFNYLYSTAISASVQKNDCGICFTGSFSLVSIPASQSFDSCSQANAQTKAQDYFNSISQSQANASGSCVTGSTFCVYVGATFQTDNTSQTYYPVTMSYLVTSSAASGSANAPDENDVNWVIAGYISSSQNLAKTTYKLLAQVPSGSYMWLKPRGANNEKIEFVGSDTGNATKFMYGPTFISNSFGQEITAPLESKPKLYNNYTQSLGGAFDIPFAIKIYDPLIDSSSFKPITASFIYTSSATFPSASDAKWKQFAYFPASVTAGQAGLNNAIITGSSVKESTDLFVSSSNYYYFKLNRANGVLIQFTAAGSSDFFGNVSASATIATSQSRMIQAQFTKTGSTDQASCYIGIN
jgi:hypothetical protein